MRRWRGVRPSVITLTLVCCFASRMGSGGRVAGLATGARCIMSVHTAETQYLADVGRYTNPEAKSLRCSAYRLTVGLTESGYAITAQPVPKECPECSPLYSDESIEEIANH